MADYPDAQTGGRVRTLHDLDRDGTYDMSKIFLEGIPFPTGVFPWRDGCLVLTVPDLIFARDTDGDGTADQRETLFTGFKPGNQQHRANGFTWSLDGWLVLANGDSGGTVTSVKTGHSVDIRGRDLRIKPDTGEIELLTGMTQYGRTRDDHGNWFGCNNSNPGWHIAIEDRYLARNPPLRRPRHHRRHRRPRRPPPRLSRCPAPRTLQRLPHRQPHHLRLRHHHLPRPPPRRQLLQQLHRLRARPQPRPPPHHHTRRHHLHLPPRPRRTTVRTTRLHRPLVAPRLRPHRSRRRPLHRRYGPPRHRAPRVDPRRMAAETQRPPRRTRARPHLPPRPRTQAPQKNPRPDRTLPPPNWSPSSPPRMAPSATSPTSASSKPTTARPSPV